AAAFGRSGSATAVEPTRRATEIQAPERRTHIRILLGVLLVSLSQTMDQHRRDVVRTGRYLEFIDLTDPAACQPQSGPLPISHWFFPNRAVQWIKRSRGGEPRSVVTLLTRKCCPSEETS